MVGTHQPIRLCIGCGEKLPQNELVRIKLSSGKLVIDNGKRKLSGRSVYLCPKESCFQNALRKGTVTFRASKYHRLTIHLSAKERDHFIYELRRYVRSHLARENG